jgi:TRAP-type C4-dicarboxylate transport system permease small subunit
MAKAALRLRVLLEWIVVSLVFGLAGLVVVGVVYRKLGASLVFYDEVASILLAWLTYYGAALAALDRAHIGFPGLAARLNPARRRAALLLNELVVIGFFALLIWAGFRVMTVLQGTYLVSLPLVPARLAYSALPIGALLFIVAECLTFHDRWRRAGTSAE